MCICYKVTETGIKQVYSVYYWNMSTKTSIKKRACLLFPLVISLLILCNLYVYNTTYITKETNVELGRNHTLFLKTTIANITAVPEINANKVKRIFNSSCVNYTNDVDRLLICGNIEDSTYQRKIVLTTTITDRKEQLFIFNNTITIWSRLIKNGVQPVMYLSDGKLYKYSDFLQRACKLGWVILKTPECNIYGYPVLKHMVLLAQKIYPNAEWYGYANGDILFDFGLPATLNFLQSIKDKHNVTTDMVVGQRYDILLNRGAHLTDETDFLKRINAESIRGHHAEDYFITQKGGFSWEDIPPIVIGRSAYDNWLVWYIKTRKKIAVDATESIMAVHQGIAGKSQVANSHAGKGKGGYYNHQFLKKGWSWAIGRTNCLAYKTTDFNRTPFLVFPIKSVQRKEKKDYENMLHYMKHQLAIKYLLQSDIYNMSILNNKSLHTLLQEINLNSEGFDNNTLTAFYNGSLSYNTSSSVDPMFSFNGVNVHKKTLVTNLNQQYNFERKSKIVLLQRYNYPRHCKELHDPRIIPVKVMYLPSIS